MDFRHTTILITGASQGIGRYLAIYFAQRGADLIITARNEINLNETASQILDESGHDCLAVPSDLRDRASLEVLVEIASREGRQIDILINNAADVTSKPFLETSLEEIDDIITANVTGCLQLTRMVAEDMAQRGSGMVINISSLAGYKPNPAQTVYGISKAAVNGISDALYRDLRKNGIHVMNVGLASVGVEKPFTPHQVPVAVLAKRLERAIARRQPELFLSPLTKWLMRLYRFFPPLSRLR